MKNLFIALIAAVALFTFSDAEAASVRGFIEAVDTETRTVKLDNGIDFILDEDLDVSEYVPGSKVKIRYKDTGGDRVATKVLVFSTPQD